MKFSLKGAIGFSRALIFSLLTTFVTLNANAGLYSMATGDEVTDLALTNDLVLDVAGDLQTGLLMGAYNVNVGRDVWDLRFVDGTFAQIFGDEAGLDRTNVNQGRLFSEQLGRQVLGNLLSGVTVFNYNPSRINGCELSDITDRDRQCLLFTPYAYDEATETALLAGVINDIQNINFFKVLVTESPVNANDDLSIAINAWANRVFVEWARASTGEFRVTNTPNVPGTPVSEPQSIGFLALFLLLFWNALRRRNEFSF